MTGLTMQDLEKAFQEAKEGNFKFIGIKVHMEGFLADEIIINPIENFESKLEYYKKTYDENCNHKFAQGISIVAVDYEDFVDALEFFIED